MWRAWQPHPDNICVLEDREILLRRKSQQHFDAVAALLTGSSIIATEIEMRGQPSPTDLGSVWTDINC
jgi:hypothetical protein